jgi:DNA polymerase III epsilon subunit-like protein
MGNFTTAKATTFFDIETTSLDPKRSAILEISIITDWDNGNTDTWTTKIKPRPVELEFASDEALKICGYNESDWSDAPTFEEVAETIAKKLRFGPIIAHNIDFDVNHLTAVFERYGYKKWSRDNSSSEDVKTYSFGYPKIDTCALSYLFLPTERQNLDTLREHLDIPSEGAHTAGKDTKDCRQVFYHIISNTIAK